MALNVRTFTHGIALLIASEESRQHEQNFAENLALFLGNFESFAAQKEALSSAITAKQSQFHLSICSNDSLYWKYTVKALCLLCALVDLLSEEQTPATASGHFTPPPTPHAPKHMLSAADQKLVQCLLQRAVYIGVYPYLPPGVDTLVKARLKHLRGAAKVAATGPTERGTWHLFKCCQLLLRCAESDALGPLVLAHNFPDLLVALIQVGHGGPGGRESGGSHSHPDGAPAKPVELDEPVRPTPQAGDRPAQASPRGGGSEAVGIAEMEVGWAWPSARAWASEALSSLLDRVYQPVVVRELLYLQTGGGPPRDLDNQGGEGREESARNLKWLQRVCGQLLSERLMRKSGVQSVLRGIFDAMAGSGDGVGGKGGSAEDSAQSWRKCRSIAQVFAHCPSQASSTEHYYSLVCPQVLELLHHPVNNIQQQLLRVTVAIMVAMVTQNRVLAERYLLAPLLQPLDVLCTVQDPFTTPDDNKTLEGNLLTCTSDLCKICGVLEPTSALVPLLTPYLRVIFEVSQVCDGQNLPDMSTVQQLSASTRSPATSVLCYLLSAVDMDSALQYLLPLPSDCPGVWGQKGVHPSWHISAGPAPGLIRIGPAATLHGGSGEEEVTRMEGRACHVIGLLRTELKASKLAGPLCLRGLVHMEGALHRAVYGPSLAGGGPMGSSVGGPVGGSVGGPVGGSGRTSSVGSSPIGSPVGGNVGTSSSLLDLEEGSGGGEDLDLVPALFLVAALCEHMSWEVVEEVDLPGVLRVLLHLLTCYADFVRPVAGGGCRGNLLQIVRTDLDSLPGGVIPMSIAIGLLSSVMGGARKVSRNDRPLLTQFLGPLELVSAHVPLPELQTQASELRICIATMGAVWSSELETSSADLTEKAKDVCARRKRVGQSKLIEELPLGPSARHPSGGVATQSEGVSGHPGGVTVQSKGVSEHPGGVVGDSATQLSPIQAALRDLQDPLLPVRAHGLLALARLVGARDGDALSHSPSLAAVFRENLRHTDSYIYLAAIDGLVALASTMPKDTIPLLCQEYIHLSTPGSPRCKEGELSEKVLYVLKVGEALVRVSRELGAMLPQYSEALLSAVMVNVRSVDVVIRTSALSNLADMCGLLHWSFGRIQNEVLGCITDVLQTDKEPQVRQAALLVLKLLIKGLSQDAFQVLGGSLRDVYRLLKLAEGTEGDSLTREHAQAALGELDHVTRTYLFPQETLTKKISVLDHV